MESVTVSVWNLNHFKVFYKYSPLKKRFQDVTANEDWNQCLDINGMSLARCIYNCDDNIACEIDCVANFKTKTVDCPCEVSWNGVNRNGSLSDKFCPWSSWLDSDDSLRRYNFKTKIKDNCPSGCPCELYDCDDTSPTITSTTSMATTTTEPSPKEAVLMLCSKTSTNIPMVIGFNGKSNIFVMDAAHITSDHISIANSFKERSTMILTSLSNPELVYTDHVQQH